VLLKRLARISPLPSRLIRQACERCCRHFDTAEAYGNGRNGLFMGEALKPSGRR